MSTVKAAAEPQMPPLDAPRCPADFLGWHVIVKDLTTFPILNGESGVVKTYDPGHGAGPFLVQLDSPRTRSFPSVRCHFSELIPVRQGSDQSALEKSLADLLALSRGRRS